MPDNQELPKEEEPFGLGCALEYFVEHEEIFKMIDNLKTIVNTDRSHIERAYEKFSFLLGQYIEQPHLLDSHLNEILEKFVAIIRDNDNSMDIKHLAFKYMYVVVNVRGYKVIVRHLPHEVCDFEVVLKMLEAQDPNDSDTWTTRYILLLWLSIIVIIPFHMSRFDGFDDKASNEKTVMTRVLDLIKIYAVVPDKCRDAAAYLSYKFITRNDVKEKHLSSFFDWAISQSSAEFSSVFVRYGTLACVATILKHGKREDLLLHTRKLLDWIINANFKNNSGSNVQKLCYKIIQRIGLTFIPPRVAAWRYKRGNRSLAANLSGGDNSKSSGSGEEEMPVDDDIEVPEEVEEVIDQLLQALKSADSIVRWSAAKGVGRVTGRLPKELADEVVGFVLELFNPRESDGAWHGGCLALAELGRRGLLLPERLPQVVPVVLKALVYDEPRGYSSVGSHIRDSACYVCWSFARAYDTHILNPYVKEIASTLLVVTCFDKEINCRRAASASFQENVGRQGSFPHGIEILTEADFFTVSVRNNAYLNISVFIAQFEEYTIPLIEHLLTRKIDHWDSGIRELAAKSLHNLTPKAPDYMVKVVLPALFEKTMSIDMNSRHGSVLAVGEVLNALSKICKQKNELISSRIPADILEKTKNLVLCFRERLFYRGLGGELMKQACSGFIQKCSEASMPFHSEDVTENWLQLLNECLAYKVTIVRTAAISALPVLLYEYYQLPEKSLKCQELVKDYVKELSSTNEEIARMGHALALGSLPKFILKPNLDFVITSLVESAAVKKGTLKWAESRRDTYKALTSIVATMEQEIGKELSEVQCTKILESFLEGLKDYTQDNRGDTGAWVREACMTGLQTVTLLLAVRLPTMLTEQLVGRILSGIAQQAVEKIDRTRALAGRAFYSLIYNTPIVPNIAHYESITAIFPKEECDILNWNSGAITFPKFVQLLQLPPYTYNVMLGLVCSIGGLTESLVINSSTSFFSYLQTEAESKGSQEIQRLSDVILKIFIDHQRNDRITVPMFRFLDKLLDSGCIDFITADSDSEFVKRTLKLIQMEIVNCRDIYKLIDGINVLCQFVQIKGVVCSTALAQLSILLCHRQSYVRRSTANKLYESLLVNGSSSNIDEEQLDKVTDLLSCTDWEVPVEEIRPIRNELCYLMGIRVPIPAKKKT